MRRSRANKLDRAGKQFSLTDAFAEFAKDPYALASAHACRRITVLIEMGGGMAWPRWLAEQVALPSLPDDKRWTDWIAEEASHVDLPEVADDPAFF